MASTKTLFKASALWADAFFKSKCPSVCPSVRLSVCPSVRLSVCSLLRYRLTVFLPPLPEVGCPIFLEIRNPWGKVMERIGLRYEHFSLKIVKNRVTKKVQIWLIFQTLSLISPKFDVICIQPYSWLENYGPYGSFGTMILGSLIVSPVLWILSSRNTLSVTHSDKAS